MNFERLRQDLKPLDLAATVPASVLEKTYFDYYHLDFEHRYEGVEHFFGAVASGQGHLASHYFRVKNASAACVMLHGYFDHAGLCSHAIDYFIRRGISVVIFDLPGHGLSTGESAAIDDFSQYQVALLLMLSVFTTELPSQRILMGQSTGGAIAMEYLLTHRDSFFSASILFAPLVRPLHWPVSRLLLALLKPFLHSISRSFSVNSHDTEFLDFVKSRDPLQAKRLPLSWLVAFDRWLPRFLGNQPRNCSLLVVQGSDDKTVDANYNLPIIREKFPMAEVHCLHSGRHHLMNESEPLRVEIAALVDDYLRRCNILEDD